MNRPSRSVRPLAPLGLLAAAALAAGCSSGHAATTPPSPSPARVTVTSTLDGHTVLPHRIHWQAFASTPAGHISKVDYLIDGRLSWVETLTPYFYGRDGNWLVTSFLKSGEHTFTVRAFTPDGRTATDTVKASVAASAAPPAALAGTWTRVVTPADVKQATTDQPPPAGRWRLQIGPTGWQLHDPSGGGSALFDVGYRPGGSMQMRPVHRLPAVPAKRPGWLLRGHRPAVDLDVLSRWQRQDAHPAPGRPRPLRRPDGDPRRHVDDCGHVRPDPRAAKAAMTAARPPLRSSSAARRRCDARWGGAFLGLAQRAIRCGGGRGAPRGPGRDDQADGEDPKASEPG